MSTSFFGTGAVIGDGGSAGIGDPGSKGIKPERDDWEDGWIGGSDE